MQVPHCASNFNTPRQEPSPRHQKIKPPLKRYTWSRFHSDLLDDNRWSLVARRTNAPLPLVEALLVRLEVHANKSRPRGYIGDFSIDGMAARWGVEAELLGRIFAEFERPDIGWIDQEQLVTFWERNPDMIDETAAVRQQRVRDRKKGMKVLASQARLGVIAAAQRHEREIALKDSKEPANVIAGWPESTLASRRDSVTVTTRADHIIKQDSVGPEADASRTLRSDRVSFYPAGDIKSPGEAKRWLRTEGEHALSTRLFAMRSKTSRLIERWSVQVNGNLVALVVIIKAAMASPANGEALEAVIERAIGRRTEEETGPKLSPPPVATPRARRRLPINASSSAQACLPRPTARGDGT